jgi:transporter family-2 protein
MYLLYLFVGFLTGLSVLLTIIILGNLTNRVGLLQTAFINYIVGTIFAIIIALFTNIKLSTMSNIPIYMYSGALIGIFVTMLNGKIITKIPAIYTTVIVFIGQVTTGLIIDYCRTGKFEIFDLIGGLLVIVGLVIYNVTGSKVNDTKISP